MLSFLYWYCLHSSLSTDFQSQGSPTTERKNLCKSDNSRGGDFSGCPECYLRNLRVSPYNRDNAIISFPLESAASSFLRWGNCGGVSMLYFHSICVVYSNSLKPGPEMTSFLGFVVIVWFAVNFLILIFYLS